MRLKTVYALLALTPILLGGPKVASPIPCEIQEQFSLDTTHYKKVVIVEGFPVVASAKVSDFALLEAAYLLDKMLGHQPKCFVNWVATRYASASWLLMSFT